MTSSSSQFSGWYSRSTSPNPKPTTDRYNLVLELLLNSPSQPEGFICAFFRPNIVVDSVGHVLSISQDDFDGIVGTAYRICDLPDTGSFRNTWRVKHPMTCREIQRLFVKKDDGSLKETSVYGYSKTTNILEKPIGEFITLPQELIKILELLQEARIEDVLPQEDMIERVKSLLE